MGQRSQLVIRYQVTDPDNPGEIITRRIARYFHWNYGHFMAQRAAQAVKLLNVWDSQYGERREHFRYYAEQSIQGLAATFSVNQLSGDVQGLDKHDDMSRFDIAHMDNNNGVFLVDVDIEGNWTSGFLIGTEDDGDMATVSTAREYLVASGFLGEGQKYLTATDNEAMFLNLDILTTAEKAGHLMDQETADALGPSLTPITEDEDENMDNVVHLRAS